MSPLRKNDVFQNNKQGKAAYSSLGEILKDFAFKSEQADGFPS